MSIIQFLTSLFTDSRVNPNKSRTVQGTKIYDVQPAESRTAGAPQDSRTAGAPIDSRTNTPTDSRN